MAPGGPACLLRIQSRILDPISSKPPLPVPPIPQPEQSIVQKDPSPPHPLSHWPPPLWELGQDLPPPPSHSPQGIESLEYFISTSASVEAAANLQLMGNLWHQQRTWKWWVEGQEGWGKGGPDLSVDKGVRSQLDPSMCEVRGQGSRPVTFPFLKILMYLNK